VLEEVREAAKCKTDYHDCYRKVYRLIRDHDKRMAAAFDDPRRSNAFLLLANIISEGLLTAEELKQFSQEAQARIKMIQELRGA
jgi:site-specific DNA-adenine methylase